MKKEIVITLLGTMLFATVLIALSSCSNNKEVSAYNKYAEKNVKYYTNTLSELYNIAENNFDIVNSTLDTVMYHKIKKQVWDNFIINFDELDLDEPLEYYLTNEPDLVLEKFFFIIDNNYMKNKINPNVDIVIN